ncbi:MAG: CDP-glucose 4,6-dehydratase [Deltaproteobacteria bacterium]|nr:CDP-glucose 4,6-dehydratase [Deltaproteobacteria bacterium]MBI3294151.1 CDP-glucose 4,6-dehydratase [Deltaproteobacteria bacterium]
MFGGHYLGKRVLVTGHTGFKGSWLSSWLLKLGAEVAGYSLNTPSSPSLFEELTLTGRIRHTQGDVRDLELLKRTFREFRPEIVFHLAAQSIVKTSYDAPQLTFDTNLLGTVNVLECLRSSSTTQAGVIITSDKCYENVEWEYGYRETDRLGGKDPYSASKACAEIAFSSYSRSFFADPDGCHVASVRAGNVIGGGDWAKNRLVPDLMRSWSKKETAVLRNPHSTRPWQHVLEPLSGYLWLGAQLRNDPGALSGEAFNFGPESKADHSVVEVARALEDVWPGRQVSAQGTSGAVAEAGLLKLNCDKSNRRLGWLSTLSFLETIDFTGSWYRRFYEDKASANELTVSQIDHYETLARERKQAWLS